MTKSRSQMKLRLVLLCTGVAGSLVLLGLALAQVVDTGPNEQPEPLPAVKATEAARPTPTPVPATRCLEGPALCSFVDALSGELSRGMLDQAVATGNGVTVTCPDQAEESKMAAACRGKSPGAVVAGFTAGSVAKPIEFLPREQFIQQVISWLGLLPQPWVIVSVGCPSGLTAATRSCDKLFTLTVSSTSNEALMPVLLTYELMAGGTPALLAAFRALPEGAPLRGGPMGYGFLVGGGAEYMWFTPLAP